MSCWWWLPSWVGGGKIQVISLVASPHASGALPRSCLSDPSNVAYCAQIARLGGTEQWETLFVGKQICKTTFLEGISLTMKSSTNHHDSTTTVFIMLVFDVSLLGKIKEIEIFVTEVSVCIVKAKKLVNLELVQKPVCFKEMLKYSAIWMHQHFQQ